MRTQRSPRILSLSALLLFALSNASCISVRPEEPQFPTDGPTYLRPAARDLRGARWDRVVVTTADTVANVPFETQLLRRLAERVKPTVVSIYVNVETPVRVRLFPFTPSFRVRLPGQALGSGFFIHSSGYILSNNHVIADARQIKGLTADEKELDLVVVARDPVYDLALLKVRDAKESFSVLPMGDSDAVGVGDMVIAVGNPLGLGHTVTFGIISQTGRNLSGISKDEGRFASFIQTDTAINPGSSGGPLITLSGAWVGVNTAGVPGAQNIGFSVPSSEVKEFLDEILAGQGVWEDPGF